MESQLQTDSGIRILAFLIYHTGVQNVFYCAYFWCVFMLIFGVHLSDTFRYFLLLVRIGSELFGIPAQTDSGIRILAFLKFPTEKLLCLFLVFICSDTFSYFTTLSQERVRTLWSLSSD